MRRERRGLRVLWSLVAPVWMLAGASLAAAESGPTASPSAAAPAPAATPVTSALPAVNTTPAVVTMTNTPDDPAAEIDDDGFRAPRWLGWGVRFGVASDPDQVLAGVQFDFGDVARRVYLEPNIEIGVGDNHTILKTTGALHYRFQRQRSFRPFVGGGITLGLDYKDPPNRGSSTDFEIALRLLGGGTWTLKSRREFFVEGAIIIGDLHDFQVMLGWRF